MFLLSKLNYRTWSQWSETECGNKEEKSSVFSKTGWRARAGELRWQTIVCWQISQWTEQTGYSVLHRACKATLTTFQIPHFLSVLPLVLTAQKCIITKPSPTKILRKGLFFFVFVFYNAYSLWNELYICKTVIWKLEVLGEGVQLKWGIVRCISTSVKMPHLYMICMLVLFFHSYV